MPINAPLHRGEAATPHPCAAAPSLRDNEPSPSPTSLPATPARDGQGQEWHTSRIEFTGQGREYFKLWLVNLLLTLATLGLFHPWARVRKLRYLSNATVLDGHALAFHGQPWPLLRGYLLLGLLFLLADMAMTQSATTALAASLVVALLLPALWRSALRYRVGHTSWRGMRFQFTGSRVGAYLPFLVVGSPMLVFAAVLATASGQDEPPTPVALNLVLALCLALSALLLPAGLYLLKRYQHAHVRLGSWQTAYQGRLRDFYQPFLATMMAYAALFLLAPPQWRPFCRWSPLWDLGGLLALLCLLGWHVRSFSVRRAALAQEGKPLLTLALQAPLSTV